MSYNNHMSYILKSVVAVLAAATLGAGGKTHAAPPSYLVRGTVVAENGEPLEGANVILKGTTLGDASDARGVFEIRGVNPGDYTLRVSYFGYATQERSITVSEDLAGLSFEMVEAAFDIEAVVVTGSRVEKPLKNTPALTEIVTERQMQTSASVTVVDALEYNMPSVNFSPGLMGHNMRMQGLDNNYVLILQDGERVAGENRGMVDLSRFNSSQIERIETLKGAASSTYGSNAIGGVINIISKKPKRPLEADFSSRFGANGERTLGGSVGSKLDRFSFRTDFTHKHSDGYDLTPKTEYEKTVQEYSDYTLGQRVGYAIDDRTSVELDGRYYTYERFDFTIRPVHPKYYNWAIGGNVKRRFSEKSSVRASWHIDDYEKYDVFEELGDEERRTYRQRIDNGRASATFDWIPQNVTTVGVEYLKETLFSTRVDGDEREASDYVGFLQNEYAPLERLTLTLGARLNNHSTYGTHFTPQISALYQVLPFNVRASYGAGYRAPSLKELYMNWDHMGMFFIKGNENLNPETSYYATASVEYLSASFIGSIAAYYNSVDQMIEERQQPDNPSLILYENVNEASIRGVDVLTKTDLGAGVAASVGYSYLDAIDEVTDLQLWGTIRHSGRIRVDYDRRFGDYAANANIQAKLNGEKIYEGLNDRGFTERQTFPGSAVWRAAVSLRRDSYGSIVAGVDNIFDYTDPEHLTVVTPGRTFFVSVAFAIHSGYFQ
ncbi:MAG: TonB-dependent receptor [Ignavibacteriales bacterium]|nr:TonB-dependent receptor [Ignavibacteriales bacterium]